MKVKLGRVDDIISAFNSIKSSIGSIQRQQERANYKLSRLSLTASSINTKIASQVTGLRYQIYVFSGNMGWLGIWDISTDSIQGNYIGFVNVGISDEAIIKVAIENGDVFLLGGNRTRLLRINPYLPGVTRTMLFDSVASFEVSPGGQRVYVTQYNSSIMLEVDAWAGRILRTFNLPGTGLHLTLSLHNQLIYFTIAGTKAVYSMQQSSGNVAKVFDMPGEVVKMAPYNLGSKSGLLVLNGSGETAAITRWEKSTGTTSAMQLPDASELVVNPFTGENYVVSLADIVIRSLEGSVLRTVNLDDTARQLTLSADGIHLVAVFSAGKDALVVDTITGEVSPGPKAAYSTQTATLLAAHAQSGYVSS